MARSFVSASAIALLTLSMVLPAAVGTAECAASMDRPSIVVVATVERRHHRRLSTSRAPRDGRRGRTPRALRHGGKGCQPGGGRGAARRRRAAGKVRGRLRQRRARRRARGGAPRERRLRRIPERASARPPFRPGLRHALSRWRRVFCGDPAREPQWPTDEAELDDAWKPRREAPPRALLQRGFRPSHARRQAAARRAPSLVLLDAGGVRRLHSPRAALGGGLRDAERVRARAAAHMPADTDAARLRRGDVGGRRGRARPAVDDPAARRRPPQKTSRRDDAASSARAVSRPRFLEARSRTPPPPGTRSEPPSPRSSRRTGTRRRRQLGEAAYGALVSARVARGSGGGRALAAGAVGAVPSLPSRAAVARARARGCGARARAARARLRNVRGVRAAPFRRRGGRLRRGGPRRGPLRFGSRLNSMRSRADLLERDERDEGRVPLDLPDMVQRLGSAKGVDLVDFSAAPRGRARRRGARAAPLAPARGRRGGWTARAAAVPPAALARTRTLPCARRRGRRAEACAWAAAIGAARGVTSGPQWISGLVLPIFGYEPRRAWTRAARRSETRWTGPSAARTACRSSSPRTRPRGSRRWAAPHAALALVREVARPRGSG